MKILLTGTNGFIGKNLKIYFRNKFDIVCPTHAELDLTKQKDVFEFIKRKKVSIVIHCANTNNVTQQQTEYDVLNKNLQMFFALESCNNYYDKMIYFGSGAEYDMQNYIPYMEEDYFGKFIPQDPYGFSKYIMAKSIKKEQNIYDLRLFGVYGKYEEGKRRFISNNICRSIKNMDMSINQNVKFDYLYIDDLCKIVEWFVTNTPKYNYYNVCTGKSVDLYAIANKINKVTKLERNIVIHKEGWKKEYSGNNQRLKNEIRNVEFTPMETGIDILYRYYYGNKESIYFD